MALQTPNEIGTIDFGQNMLKNALEMPDKTSAVWQLYSNLNIIDFLVTKNQRSRQTRGLNGNFSKWVIGALGVVGTVSSTAASANPANLTITLTDPTFNQFLEGDTVGDGTAAMNQGTVVSTSPGSIEIEPAGNTITTGWTSAFAAGTVVVAMWNTSPQSESDSPGSRYYSPSEISNRTSVMRISKYVKSSEFFQTWASPNGVKRSEDGGMWATSFDKYMGREIAIATEFRALWSQPGVYAPGSGGSKNYSMGLKAAIQDPIRGGVYRGWTNLFTEDQFINWVVEVCNRQGTPNNTFKLVCGRNAFARVQSFNTNMIVNTGVRNTVGGESVEGFDSYKYAIAGFSVDLIIHPMLTSPIYWKNNTTIPGITNNPRMGYTMILLDETMYPTATSDGTLDLPAMEKVYFPAWGDGTDEIYYYIPGIGGSNLAGAGLSGMEMQTGNLAVTGKPGFTFGYYSDFCYDFVATNMGWAELLV